MTEQLGLFPEATLPKAPAGVGPNDHPEEISTLAGQLPAGLRLGTSSWSFPGWEGIVYDRRQSESVLSRDGLGAYATHPLFKTVGLDRTFYAPISADRFAEYAEAVPDDFRFLVKADRLLTFPTGPHGHGVRGPNARFLDVERARREVVEPLRDGLGAKAGVLLFQFPPMPPNLVGGRERFAEDLRRFLGELPESGSLRYAIELRTPGLLTESYARVLEETGAAHCYVVHPAMSPLAEQTERLPTLYQPALIVRWMLHAGLRYEAAKDRYAPFDRLVDEDRSCRDRIATMILDAAVAEREAFIIANNKAEGSAPLTLTRLAERVVKWDGAPADTPD